MQIRPLRSVLFLPASNERAIEKAKNLDADGIIFDLEDAVAEEAKTLARNNAVNAVKSGNYGNRFLVIRTNGLDTQFADADIDAVIDAVIAAKPDAILIPKVEYATEITNLLGRANGIAIWAMVESARGIINAVEIADALSTNPQNALVIGPNDIARDTRMRASPSRTNLLPALTNCVFAARAAGIQILDGVYNNFRDDDGFATECTQGRDLGMDGKTLIHPGQIAAANEAFSPSPEEISSAQEIVGVFDRPENQKANVVQINGKMVERLHAGMARQLLEFAKTIGKT